MVNTTVDPLPAIIEQYHQAIKAYQEGEFEKAADKFMVIRERTADKNMARKALYGLACSRLMTAQTPEAYRIALTLWQTWVETAPRSWENENPLLMAPLVRDKMLVSNIPLTQKSAAEADSGKMVPQWLLVTTIQELDKLKRQLDETEKGAQLSRKKNSTLEKEIERLKEQIKALETIDQKIQKKKNAIPSAD